MATFIIKRDTQRQFYWILRSDKNYKIVAKSSESYDTLSGAKDSIDWTKANVKNASIEDES